MAAGFSEALAKVCIVQAPSHDLKQQPHELLKAHL